MSSKESQAITGNTEQQGPEPHALHELRNQLSIIVGFFQILLKFSERQMLWTGEAFLEKPFSPKALLEAASLLLFDRTDGLPA